MAAVMVKNSPQGSVVIAHGFGWVTASALMTHREALKLAAQITGERAKARRIGA